MHFKEGVGVLNLSRTIISSCLFAVGLAAILNGTGARADTNTEEPDNVSAEAKKFFNSGINLLRMENLEGASREFERSVTAQPTVSALFNLANCYKGMHRYEQAMRTFQRLRADFGDELKPAIIDAVSRHESDIIKVAAQLEVKVSTAGAKVLLGGTLMGQGPFQDLLYLSPGTHELLVEADGFESYRKLINAYSGQTQTINIKLKSILSFLHVSSNVQGASLLVDGKVKGETPLAEPVVIPAGPHLIELSKFGYLSATKTVNTQPEESVSVDFVLVPTVLELSQTPAPVQEPRDKPTYSVLTWVGGGLTLASGVACGVFYIIAYTHYLDFKATGEKIEGLKPEDSGKYGPLDDKQGESASKTKLFANLGLGFGIAAGAFAIVTGVSMGLDIKKHRKKTEERISFGTTPTSLWFRF